MNNTFERKNCQGSSTETKSEFEEVLMELFK